MRMRRQTFSHSVGNVTRLMPLEDKSTQVLQAIVLIPVASDEEIGVAEGTPFSIILLLLVQQWLCKYRADS